ncbi:MAG TPA: NADH-ubiquinone oxidoreductase [Stellaceae bacterium]|nr:NADH-ubiquinone oxidoreductase [Stellaceae bacterium]
MSSQESAAPSRDRAGQEAGRVVVIGASSPLGRRLVTRVASRGVEVIATARSADSLAGLPATARAVGLADQGALAAVLADASRVVVCAHARFAPTVLAALPGRLERIVFTGSARRFTRFPDAAAEQVIAAEAALARSGRPGVVIHPTMICGAGMENNVQRVAAYIRRFGVVPLPEGGRRLIQPIDVDDLAACLEAALYRDEAPGAAITAAGPAAVAYRDFVRAIARAIGRRVRILPVPASLLMAAAVATRVVPGAPRIAVEEVRRLSEDKAFDIGEMRRRLGVEPRDLDATLRRTLAEEP